MANIRLNILPVTETDFNFTIYRKLREDDDQKQEGILLYQLPITDDTKDRKRYWLL